MFNVIDFFGDTLKAYCIISTCDTSGKMYLEATSDDKEILLRYSTLLNETRYDVGGYHWTYSVCSSAVVTIC